MLVLFVCFLAREKFAELADHVNLHFLMALGIGLALAVITLSSLLTSLLEDETGRIYLFAFFFGLVVASIIAIGLKELKWSVINLGFLIGGAVFAFLLVRIVPAEASHEPIYLFLSGMVAICAMILPGISGSFILLILGQYDYVINAVHERDLPTIFYVGIGATIGIIAFSRVLSWLLAKYYQPTIAILVGFMIGSLWKIYPWKECSADEYCLEQSNYLPDFASSQFAIALGLMIVGFVLVSVLDHLQDKDNPIMKHVWK